MKIYDYIENLGDNSVRSSIYKKASQQSTSFNGKLSEIVEKKIQEKNEAKMMNLLNKNRRRRDS